MKPLDGTFAQNALEHGVAGLNIDGCRIGTDGGTARSHQEPYGDGGRMDQGGSQAWRTGHDIEPINAGRWPANVVLDEDAARMLDEQSGVTKAGNRPPGRNGRSSDLGWRMAHGGGEHGDEGGASRFFYTSKASRADRGPNNTHPTVKPSDLMKWLVKLTATPTGGTVLDPFMGSGTTLYAAKEMGRKAIGIEIEERYCEIAAKRLAQEVLAL